MCSPPSPSILSQKRPGESVEAVVNRLCLSAGALAFGVWPSKGCPCPKSQGGASGELVLSWRQVISLPGCTASSILCASDPLPRRPSPAPLDTQTPVTAPSAFREHCTTGNVEAISLPILQQCFSSAISLITGDTSVRQDICSSPHHYHHLDLLLLPYVPQLLLQSHSAVPGPAGMQLAPLRKEREGGTGLKADIGLTGFSVDLEESGLILYPYTTAPPYSKFFCNLYYCESRLNMLLHGNSSSFTPALTKPKN